MDEIVISRGSGKSALNYMVRLHELYKSGAISKTDYLTMRSAALVLLFGMSEQDVLKQIKKELEEDDK